MAIRASIWEKFLKSPSLNRSVITKISYEQIKNFSSDFNPRQAGKCRCLACTKERQKVAMHRFLTRSSDECYVPSQPVKSKNFCGEDIRSMMVTFGPPQSNARRPSEPPCSQQSPPCLAPSSCATISYCQKPTTSNDESILCKACNKMRNVCRDYCEPSSNSGGQPCTLEKKKNSIICNWCERIKKLCDDRCTDLSCEQPSCCPPPPPQPSTDACPQSAIECYEKPSTESCPKAPIECCPSNMPKCAPPPPPPPPEPIPCPPPRPAEMCSPEPCPNSFCLVKKGPANKCKQICDKKKNRLPPKYSKPDCTPSKCSPPNSIICSPPPPKPKEVCLPPTPPKCSPPVPSKAQEPCPPPPSKDCCEPAPTMELSEICPPPVECCQPPTDCCLPPLECEPPPPICEPPPPKCESPKPKCEPQPIPCTFSRYPPPPKCDSPPKPTEKCCSPQTTDTRLCTDPASTCYQLLRNNILEMHKAGQMYSHDPVEQKKQSDIICQSCQSIWEMCKCDCYCGAAPTPSQANSCKKLCTDPCSGNYLELKKKISILYEAAMVCCDEPKVQLKQQNVICQGVRNIMAICDCCPKPCSKPPNSPPCPPKNKGIIETVKKFALSMCQPKTSCVKQTQIESCRSACQSSIPTYSSSKSCCPKLCTDPNSSNYTKMRSIAKQIYDRSSAECDKIADQEAQHTLLCRCCQTLWKICDCGCFDPGETLPKDPCKKLCTNPTSINYERMLKTICVLYQTAMTTCKLPDQQKDQHRLMCRCIRSIMEMCNCHPEPSPTNQPDCPSPPMGKCCEQPSVQTKTEKKSTDAFSECFEELTKTTSLLFEASKKLCTDPSERKLLSDQILKYCCKIQELCKSIDASGPEPHSNGKCDSSGSKKNYWLVSPPKNSGCGQLRKYKRDSRTLGMDSNTNDEKSNLLNQDQIDELICESCRNIILMCDCRQNSNLIQSRSLSHLNTLKQKSNQFLHDQQQRSVSSDASQKDLKKKVRLNRRKLKIQCSETKIKGSTKGSLFFRGRKSRSQRRHRSFSHYRYMGNDVLATKCWKKLYEIFERRSSTLYRNHELNKVECVSDPLIKKNTVYAECVQRPDYLKKMVEDYVRSPTGYNDDENHSSEIQGTHKSLSTEKLIEYESAKLQEDGHELNYKEITNKVNDLGQRQSKDTSTDEELPILKEIVGTYNPETKKPLCIALVVKKDDYGRYQKWHGEIGLVKDKEKWIENIKSRKPCGSKNNNNMQKLEEASDVPTIVAKKEKSLPQKFIEKSKSKKIIDSPNKKKRIDELKASKSDESKSEKLIDQPKRKLKKVFEEPKNEIGLQHTKKLIELSKYSKSKFCLNSVNEIWELYPKQCRNGYPQETKDDCGHCQRNDSQISLAKATIDRGLPKNQKRKSNVKINEIDFKKAERLEKVLRLDKVLSSVQKSAINIDQGQFGFECIPKKYTTSDSHNKSKDIKPTKVDVNKGINNSKDNKKIKTIVNHRKESKSISNTSNMNNKGGKSNAGDSHNKSGDDSDDFKPPNLDINKSITNPKDNQKIETIVNQGKESRSLDNTSQMNYKGGKSNAGDSQNKSGDDSDDSKPTKGNINKSITNSKDERINKTLNHQKESRSLDDTAKLNDKVDDSYNKSGLDFKYIKLPKANVDKSGTNLWHKISKAIVYNRKEARIMDIISKLNDKSEKRTASDSHNKSGDDSENLTPTKVDITNSKDERINTTVNHEEESRSFVNTSKLNDIHEKYNAGDSYNKSGRDLKDFKFPKADVDKSVINLWDKPIVNYRKETGSIDNTSLLNDKDEKRNAGNSHNKSGDDSENITSMNQQEKSRSLDNTSQLNDKGEKNTVGDSYNKSHHHLEYIKLPKADFDKSDTNLWDKISKAIMYNRKESRIMDNILKLYDEGGKNTTVDSHNKSEEHNSKDIKPTNTDIHKSNNNEQIQTVVNHQMEFRSMDNSSELNNICGEQGNNSNKKGESDNGHGRKDTNADCTTIRGLVEILNKKNIKTNESNNQKIKASRFMKISLQPRVNSLKGIFNDSNVDTIQPDQPTYQNTLKIHSEAESKDTNGDEIKKIDSDAPVQIDNKSIENEFKEQSTNTEIKGRKDCGSTKEAVKSKEWFNPFVSTPSRPKFEDNNSTTFTKSKTSESKIDQSDDLEFKKYSSWQVTNKKSTLSKPKYKNNTAMISVEAFKANKQLKTSGSKDDRCSDLEFMKYPPWQVTNKKVSIVGGDHMGVACATALISQNVTNNICVLDPYNHLKSEPNAMGLLSNANILPSQDSSETKNSRVVVIATNAPAQQSDSYVDITKRSAVILRDMVPRLVQASPHAIFIVLTNPPDLMTWYVKRISQLPLRRCFGAGCQLETARFNYLISRRLNVPPSPVIGASIGRKGPTIMPVCSSIGVRGIPLHSMLPETNYDEFDDTMKEVRRVVTAPTMVRHVTKRYTTWGIGNTTSDIVSAILTNNERVLSACTNAKGFHGLEDEVWLSLPCQFNYDGLRSILDIPLNDIEKENLHKSASAFLSVQHNIGKKILEIEEDDEDTDVE